MDFNMMSSFYECIAKENKELKEQLFEQKVIAKTALWQRDNAEKTLNEILEIIKDSEENPDYTYTPLKRIKRIIKKASD